MKICKSIGCETKFSSTLPGDFCEKCQGHLEQFPHPDIDIQLESTPKIQKPSGLSLEMEAGPEFTSSGGDNDYWLVNINDPKRLEPYKAECEDIIENLEMTFQEGEAFKALWRKCKLRLGDGKPGDTEVRNSEKVAHYGARMAVMDKRRAQRATHFII
ncbi:hypothetical protein [Larsenimonas suaedae]|uniref:Uncharacterized protein n=1 Tax=Larsenimonas suaedae TaxID=1851019 RepID=A0ABU1H0I5_9GAMM|nr:hypothetical protein [Larsenimonas suaedae]MCM2973797.1 hypothetical protein [Larsenimonas suaedae]MDR5897321.1 hypothetical protein [Larsenimonas suaedae]